MGSEKCYNCGGTKMYSNKQPGYTTATRTTWRYTKTQIKSVICKNCGTVVRVIAVRPKEKKSEDSK